MASYKICFKPSIEKDFRKLPKALASRIIKRIENLKSEPFPPQSTQLSNSERLYRVRVGDYRIVYEVDTKAKEVVIHYIRHRRKVYRAL